MLGLLRSKVFWIVISYFIVAFFGYKYADYKHKAATGKVAIKAIKKHNKIAKKDEKVAEKFIATEDKTNKSVRNINEKVITVRIRDARATDDSNRLYNEAVKIANSR